MTVALIGLGANLGDPKAQIRQAIRLLCRDFALVAQSSLYRSAPVGGVSQPDYINAVIAVEASCSATDMLTHLLALERSLGRVRDGERWGPRVLDLDLLLWGRETINMPDLQVPHPRMLERAFVLYPMQEIAPQCPLVANFITATCLDNPFIHSQELVLLVE